MQQLLMPELTVNRENVLKLFETIAAEEGGGVPLWEIMATFLDTWRSKAATWMKPNDLRDILSDLRWSGLKPYSEYTIDEFVTMIWDEVIENIDAATMDQVITHLKPYFADE